MEDMITRKEHEEFARRQDAEDKRLDKRISLLENEFQKLNSLTVAVEKMAVNMENMLAEQRQQGRRLEELEKEPVETYSRVKQAIITAVVGTVVGSVITVLITLL